MIPQRRTLTYEGNELQIELTLEAGTALSQMKRALFTGRALTYLDTLDAPGEDADAEDADTEDADAEAEAEAPVVNAIDAAARRLIAQYLYPDLLASVVEAEGLDPEMDVTAFLALPDALTDAWQNAVYELAPHWYPFQKHDGSAPEDAEAEKKASNSASAAG